MHIDVHAKPEVGMDVFLITSFYFLSEHSSLNLRLHDPLSPVVWRLPGILFSLSPALGLQVCVSILGVLRGC